MQIKELKLEGVGKFDKLSEFRFNPGLNVVAGENEAGKSTIMKAIETAFFGFKPIKDWKYASWNQSDTVIECLIGQKNEETLITRRYGSKIRGTTLAGHVAENIGNQPIEGNLVDLELYKSLFSISVDELAGIDKKSWKELTASLTDSYNHSAFRSAAEAQEAVQNKASEIFKESGRGQFELKDLQSTHDDLEGQIKQLQIERAYAVRSEEDIKQIRLDIEKLTEQIHLIDDKIKNYEENHLRIRRRREYRQKMKDYQQIELLELPPKTAVDRWIVEMAREEIVNREIQRLSNDLERLREALSLETQKWEYRKSEFPRLRMALSLILLMSAIGFGYYSLPEGIKAQEQLIIGVLMVFSAGVALNVGVVNTKKGKASRKVYDEKVEHWTSSIALAEMQLHHFEDEFDEIENFKKPLVDYCQRMNMNGPEEISEWISKAAYLSSAMDQLLALEEDPDGFLSTVTDEGQKDAPEEIELKSLLDERDQLTEQRLNQEQKLAHRTDLSVKEIDFKLNELMEQKNFSHKRIYESALRRDRLLLVSKIVAEAEKMYRKSQKPDFLIRASRYMKLLSHHKYDEVLMSEAGGFVLKSGNELTPMTETISRGTREQMYLALKLAMTFRLDPLGHYPILMDEIAINFDKTRRSGLYEVLKELSEQRQVIFFTCHEWLVSEMTAAVESRVIPLQF